jgi:hypothetical protein
MTCIFCQRDDQALNREHVFPESLGGAIVIKAVCEVCNHTLSKAVDDSFVRLPNLLLQRHHYKLARARRGMPNHLRTNISLTTDNRHTA